MNSNVARLLVEPGKGILAADESLPTMAKRLSRIGVPSTAETRRSYRELLLTSPGLAEHVSGVILFDETMRQVDGSGVPLPQVLARAGVVPGIKVDRGNTPLQGFPHEVVATPSCWPGMRPPSSGRHGPRGRARGPHGR